MYNAELKQRFIDNSGLTDSYLAVVRSMFNKTEAVETFFGKDLSAFTLSNYIYAFESLGFTKRSTFDSKKTIIRKYVQWCIDEHEIGNDVFNNINSLTINDLDPQRRNKLMYYTSIDEMIDVLSAVYESAGKDYLYYIRNVSFAGLVYIGIPEAQIVKIKIKDFNYDNRTIKAGDTIYNLPERLNTMIEDMPKDATVRGDGRVKPQPDSVYLYRTMKSEESLNASIFCGNISNEWKSMMKDMTIDNPNFGRRLLFDAIRYSGMCERIKNTNTELAESQIMKLFSDFESVDQNGNVVKGISCSYAYSLMSVYRQIYG